MTDHPESTPTERERALELEVARLQAELDTLRGEDPSTATSRFLAMAAATVDQAVEDARREADEIVDEISSQAEARRDEATRVAAEAEAMAEQLLAEADRAQETVDEANERAAAITADAEEEAAVFVAGEREKVAAEIEAFAEVRTALDEERVALESYHESLRTRVQEMAESMVSFMNTELPTGAANALAEVASVSLEQTSLDEEIADEQVSDGEVAQADDRAEDQDEDPLDAPAPPAPVSKTPDDPWVEMLESAIPEEDRIVDMPDTAIDEVPEGPPSTFGGLPVIEEDPVVGEDDEKSASAGLFSRARTDEEEIVGFDDLAVDHDDENESSGLFGILGSRLVEQTGPDELAEALDADDTDDQAFRQFLDGDDAPDPSRDWLLRPEQG